MNSADAAMNVTRGSNDSVSGAFDIFDLKRWINADPRVETILPLNSIYERDRFRSARVEILLKLTLPIARRLATNVTSTNRQIAERVLYADRIGLMTGIAKTINDAAIHDIAIHFIVELSMARQDIEHAKWLISQIKSPIIAERLFHEYRIIPLNVPETEDFDCGLFF